VKKIVFITPGDARPGFALAGFQQHTTTIAGVEETLLSVLVVLPAPEQKGAESQEDYALRIIRKAIGYHVRLQG
jgi:vacuolar-type H+-ATPase subunit F/Vma7